MRVPHRGEWSQLTVRLESLRVRALAPFRRLALRALRSPDVWSVSTNREAAARMGPLPARPVAEAVDRLYYGHDTPTAAEVVDVEREVESLEARARGVPPQDV
jgi:hypothetical protein